ncbi:MAG: Phosphoglucosamine mutase [Thermotoga sp. 50_1627]|nr:MAG: Phosphoglucosamine mutase [Thermotoga sp. 50_64]KUK24630.1 MAG: Phosphoglucosamine mutase [Thermotoga sp. 50_1627]HBT39550.1 phosphoglucosamine mutase [Pseudothermotoga sp.]HCO98381.1 phosphoglucosamine mutase [Pseudothermotoga sp.]
MKNLFGTDGLRGIYGDDLTDELAYRLGLALGELYGPSLFVVGHDTRESAEPLQKAIVKGLLEKGAKVKLAGVLPTPAVAMITKILNCFGIVISASHNPYQYNGIKILRFGFKLPDEEERKIELVMETVSAGVEKGFAEFDPHLRELYIEALLKSFHGLDLSGLRIAVDLANGAAIMTTPEVLNALGANVTCFSKEPNGKNINENCGSQHPEFLAQHMKGFDLGILHDGDADRCILLGENAEEIHGDKIMGVVAIQMKREGRLRNDMVVATIMSNKGLEDYLLDRGIKLTRVKVGDRYVLEGMQRFGASFGGERSGHIIFLDRSTTGDGLITALEFLRLMLSMNRAAAELSREVEDYPQLLLNVPVEDKSVAEHPALKREIEKYLGRFRIVVRASGTERLVRVMVEGKDETEVKKVVEELCGLISELDRG